MQYKNKFTTGYLNTKPSHSSYFTSTEKYYGLKEQFAIN